MRPQLLNFHIMFRDIRLNGFSYLVFIMNNQLYLSVSQHKRPFFLIVSTVRFKLLKLTL
jgi:hypothetical protein